MYFSWRDLKLVVQLELEKHIMARELSLINEMQLPTKWDHNFCDEEVHCTELLPTSSQYSLAKSLITSSLRCNIISIKRIENPFLLGCYYLKKREYEAKGIHFEEKILFHCTAKSNVQNIVKNNLDWRKTVRGRFGQGVSFSPFAEYANRYANRSIGYDRAMLIMKVLIGNKTNGSYCVDIPPLGYDTTIDCSGNVFVKFYDYEFYPMFVAEYKL